VTDAHSPQGLSAPSLPSFSFSVSKQSQNLQVGEPRVAALQGESRTGSQCSRHHLTFKGGHCKQAPGPSAQLSSEHPGSQTLGQHHWVFLS
jgi:hypothetical protein